MKPAKNVIAIFVACALLAGLSGCKKEEGPAEKAGRAIDKAVEKVGKQIEKAGEKIQEMAKGEKK